MTLIKSPLPDIPRRTMSTEIANLIWIYNPETGFLIWRVSPHRRVDVGDVAGSINRHGYRVINFKGKMYSVARLAWLIMTGDWPSREVDHINGDRADNRFINLREATRTQQLANIGVRSDNSLGVKGVHQREDGKFVSSISKDGKKHHLGCFDYLSDAKNAYDAAALRLFGRFSHGYSRVQLLTENPEERVGFFWCEPWGWPCEINAPISA